MTIAHFLEAAAAKGLMAAISDGAAGRPDWMLLQRRIEELARQKDLGLLTNELLFVERNRIAYTLESLLEPGSAATGQGTALEALSEALGDFLGITEAQKAQFQAEREQQRKDEKENAGRFAKYWMENRPAQGAPGLLPMPEDERLPLAEIPQLIASNQLALALRHLLAYSQGSEWAEDAEQLAQRMKLALDTEKRGLATAEALITAQNQIAVAAMDLAQRLAAHKAGAPPKGQWWKKLWS